MGVGGRGSGSKRDRGGGRGGGIRMCKPCMNR